MIRSAVQPKPNVFVYFPYVCTCRVLGYLLLVVYMIINCMHGMLVENTIWRTWIMTRSRISITKIKVVGTLPIIYTLVLSCLYSFAGYYIPKYSIFYLKYFF